MRLRRARGAEPPRRSAGGRGGQNQAANPFGAGCGGAGGGGGFGGGAGGGNPGPYVLGGTYTVALVVDGKPVASKPLRVLPDPEVALTEVERKKMYDMAMEMHTLQIQAAEVATQLTPFNTRLTELVKEVASRTDVPADLKTSVETLAKDVAALTPQAGGARGRIRPRRRWRRSRRRRRTRRSAARVRPRTV